jgi:hypothetical protein
MAQYPVGLPSLALRHLHAMEQHEGQEESRKRGCCLGVVLIGAEGRGGCCTGLLYRRTPLCKRTGRRWRRRLTSGDVTGRVAFEEPAVPRITPVSATEPRVNWFLESTRPEAVEGRRLVNDLLEDDLNRLRVTSHFLRF